MGTILSSAIFYFFRFLCLLFLVVVGLAGVVLIAGCFSLIAQVAHAQEPDDTLFQMETLSNPATCLIGDQPPDQKQGKHKYHCFAAKKTGDKNHTYLLIVSDTDYRVTEIIRVNPKTDKSVVVWKEGGGAVEL